MESLELQYQGFFAPGVSIFSSVITRSIKYTVLLQMATLYLSIFYPAPTCLTDMVFFCLVRFGSMKTPRALWRGSTVHER